MSSTASNFGPGRAVWLVARREIRFRVRSKSFLISLAITLVAIAAYVGYIQILGSSTTKIGVTPDAQGFVQSAPVKAAIDAVEEENEIVILPSVDAATQALKDDNVDVAVTGSAQQLNIAVKDNPDRSIVTVLQNLGQQQSLASGLDAAGVDVASLQQQAASAVTVTSIEPEDPESGQRLAIAIISVMLLYFALLLFGLQVGQGVVEEKSSRVVEILLSTFSPFQLLWGKVLGIGAVALLQVSIIVAAGVGAAVVTDVLTLGTAVIWPIIASLLWFILGFFLFSALLAAAGALVSRQEEFQSASQPVMVMIIIPFIVSFSLMQSDPNGTLATTLSMIPPFSPMLMSARIAIGDVAAWQVVVSFVVTVAAIAAVVWAASRIYSNAVLRTGSRVKLREAWHRA